MREWYPETLIVIPSTKIKISGGTAGYEAKRDVRFSWYIEFEVSLDVQMERAHKQLDGYVILEVTREVWRWKLEIVYLQVVVEPVGVDDIIYKRGESEKRRVYTAKSKQRKGSNWGDRKGVTREIDRAERMPYPKLEGKEGSRRTCSAVPWEAMMSNMRRTEKAFF